MYDARNFLREDLECAPLAGTTSVDLGEPIDSSLLFGMKAAAFIGLDKLAPRSSSLRSAGPARDFSLLGCHDAARSE